MAASHQAAAVDAPGVSLVTNAPFQFDAPNPRCSTALCTSLKELIDGAQSSIDFALYGLQGQKAVLQSLIDAKRRGVVIRGVVDGDVDGRSSYRDTHLLRQHLGAVRDDRRTDLETMRRHKARYDGRRGKGRGCEAPRDRLGPVQCFEGKGYASREKIRFKGELMHNKFFIIDRRRVWTGSANVSDTGTGGYNANIAAVINSPEVAAFYTAEFEQMFVDGKYHRAKTRFRKQDIQVNVNGENLSLYFSPQSYTVKRGVLPLLHSARESIDVAVFFLTHNGIAKALAAARKRGVAVRVILDATGAANAYSKHDYLREHGVRLKVESWGGKMHMKSAVIDGRDVIVGSMNWTKAGATKNDENTVIIRNAPDKAAQMLAFFDALWASIPDKWLHSDPLPESKDSGTSCSDGIDNDFDRVKDRAQPSCR